MTESIEQEPKIHGRLVVNGDASSSDWVDLMNEINTRCQNLGLEVILYSQPEESVSSLASQLAYGQCLVSLEQFKDHAKVYKERPHTGIGSSAWRALCRAKFEGRDRDLSSGGLAFFLGPPDFIAENGRVNGTLGKLDLLSLHRTFVDLGGYHERITWDFVRFFKGPRASAGHGMREFLSSFIIDAASRNSVEES